MINSSYINASELADYVYCKRAWWLKANGLSIETDKMKAGTKYHQNLGFKLDYYSKLKILVLITIAVGLIIILILVGYMVFIKV